MAAERLPAIMTVDEYFELERSNPEICYEYMDGYAYMMADGSFNHDMIKANAEMGLLCLFARGRIRA